MVLAALAWSLLLWHTLASEHQLPSAKSARSTPISSSSTRITSSAAAPSIFNHSKPLAPKPLALLQFFHRKLYDIHSLILPCSDPNQPMSKAKARMYVTICSMLYGSTYLFTKSLQQSIPSSLCTFLRFLIASCFFLPTIIKNLPQSSRNLIQKSVEVGLYCSIGFISMGRCLDKSSASKVAFFTSLSVVFVPILDQIYMYYRFCTANHQIPLESTPLLDSSVISITPTTPNRSITPTTPNPSITPTTPNPPQKRKETFSINPRLFIGPLLAITGVALIELGGIDRLDAHDIALLITPPIAFSLSYYQSELLSAEYPFSTSFISGIQVLTITVLSFIWCLISQQFPLNFDQIYHLFSSNSWGSLGGLLYSGILTSAWTFFVDQKAINVLTASGILYE